MLDRPGEAVGLHLGCHLRHIVTEHDDVVLLAGDVPDMNSILRTTTAAAVALAFVSNLGSALAGDANEEANRKVVLDFYEKGLNQKDADAAIALMGDRYVQHNPNAADGPEGFRKFIGFLREKFPNSKSEIKRSFVDGDYVILHVADHRLGRRTRDRAQLVGGRHRRSFSCRLCLCRHCDRSEAIHFTTKNKEWIASSLGSSQ